jgi:hypothetical protein
MGSATLFAPTNIARPIPMSDANKPNRLARKKSLFALSSPISSVIHAWVAPEVNV